MATETKDTDEGVSIKDEATIIPPFTIEADHFRNCDLLFQSVPGRLRVRSRLVGSRPIEKENGDTVVPVDQARALSTLPEIPGQHVRIRPEAGLISIADPLTAPESDPVLNRLRRHLSSQGGNDKVNGVPKREIEVDQDQMKTLLREIRSFYDDRRQVRVIKGQMPTQEAIDESRGRYLMNNGQTSFNTQPRYEDEYETWLASLSRVG